MMVIVLVPLPPCATVTLAGEAVSVKFGITIFNVTVVV